MRAKVWATAGVATTALLWGLANQGGLRFQPAEAAEASAAALPAKADNFMLADANLQSHELYRMADAPAIVIVTQANGDPASLSANKAVKTLRDRYGSKGVEFLMLNSNLQDSRDEILAEAKRHGYDIPIMLDTEQLVGEQLGVTRAAEMFVIQPKTWKVAYRGPVEGEKPWGAEAIEAVLAGKPVQVASRVSPGRLISFPERAKMAQHTKISFAREVAPIIEAKCVSCHQPGGIGPFSLTSYQAVKGFSPMIREVIRTDRMPPWQADPHVGEFSNDKSLTKAEMKTLVHWIEAGAPRGEGKDPLAATPHQAEEWPLGKPDLVLDIPSYPIPASGIVDYQRPAVANPLTEGKWLKASTIKVSQRQAVHHILTGYMKEMPKDGVGRETRWGASLGGYAVGAESEVAPKDVGTYIPAGGAIGFQNHYTPFGKDVVAADKIALYFYKDGEKPKLVMRNGTITDGGITIPAGAARHREVAYTTFPKDALLYSAFPHAHYRGHASDVTLQYPDGKQKLLLSLPKYNFNWQRHYEFKEPIKVPAGSKLIVSYTYDNSKRNPANPDPSKEVIWGDQSFEEMLYTAIRYRWVDETSDDLSFGDKADEAMAAGRIMGMFDDNVNGRVEQAELRGPMAAPFKAAWARLDANKDGGVDAAEMAVASELMRRGRRDGQAAETAAMPSGSAARPSASR
jgi:hypothetical protein